MGIVNFNTTINKTVTIDKDVNLDVDKNVTSTVNLQGSLATAEASADALGGTGGGGGSDSLIFLIDDGSDLQTTVAFGSLVGGPATNTGTAPGPNFPPPPFFPPLPDGEFFLGTDIPDSPLRTFMVRIDEDADAGGPAGGTATLASGAEPGRLQFSNDDETSSNQAFFYEADRDGDTVFGEPEDAYAIILPGADLSDPANALVITDIIFDAGVPSQPGDFATLRVEVQLTDADGDTESGAVYFTEDPAVGGGFVDGQDLVIPLGFFTGDIPNPAAGAILAPGVVNVDDDPGNPALDLDRIVRIEFRVLDDPDDADGSFDNPDLLPGENPANGGTDISIDDIFVRSFEEDNFGVLAETDTFAQVSSLGAFSFSEALAARSSLDDMMV